MGRVDAEKMYDIVKSWDWGNSGSDAIYHDTETRRNGITYRSNLARLAEQLIKEEQFEKAEEILDLAMEKMPVDKFEYYTLLEPYVLHYYEIDKTEKARKVFQQTVNKHQEWLQFYGAMNINEQSENIQEIYSKLSTYEGLLETVYVYDKDAYYQEEKKKFKEHLQPFNGLFTQLGMDINEEFLQKERYTNALLDSLLQDSTLVPE